MAAIAISKTTTTTAAWKRRPRFCLSLRSSNCCLLRGGEGDFSFKFMLQREAWAEHSPQGSPGRSWRAATKSCSAAASPASGGLRAAGDPGCSSRSWFTSFSGVSSTLLFLFGKRRVSSVAPIAVQWTKRLLVISIAKGSVGLVLARNRKLEGCLNLLCLCCWSQRQKKTPGCKELWLRTEVSLAELTTGGSRDDFCWPLWTGALSEVT